MEVSGQLHVSVSVSLPAGKEPLRPTREEAGWELEPAESTDEDKMVARAGTHLKVNCRVHNNFLEGPVLGRLDAVHALTLIPL
jgi:hypothetical protein